jgi:hypothetical protein
LQSRINASVRSTTAAFPSGSHEAIATALRRLLFGRSTLARLALKIASRDFTASMLANLTWSLPCCCLQL